MVVLYGCGGLGLEILSYLIESDFHAGKDPCRTYRFIDIAEARTKDAARILGGPCTRHASPEEFASGTAFIVTIGNAQIRSEAFARCLRAGLEPLTFVHPMARVDATACVGRGAVLAPFAFAGPSAEVGDNCMINVYASVAHDARVGESSVLSPYATLNGSAACGARAFLGTHSSILYGHRLGAYSKLAAGSVLSQSTDDGVLFIGNPARGRIMFRKPDDLDVDARR